MLLKLSASVLFLAVLAAAEDAASSTTTTTQPSLLDETRFLLGANSTSVQVSAISVIGATLIGIAIALAIGGLLPAFSGAAGAAAGGFGKRSVDDSSPFSMTQILSMVDGLRGFDVADVDCQKKVVCELHRSGASVSGTDLGVLTDKVLDVFNYILPTEEHKEVTQSLLHQYLEAAKKGKDKQDCERVYSTCEYSVRKVIRSLSE